MKKKTKYLLFLFTAATLLCCTNNKENKNKLTYSMQQQELKNEKTRAHVFLADMYQDSYYPSFMVDKVKNILLEFCSRIENEKPADLKELYILSHEATEKINDLEDEFFENNSEIETVARECIGMDFDFIASSYGYEADIEELIAPRNW